MYRIQIDQHEFQIQYTSTVVELDGKPFQADVLEYKAGKFHILHNNKSFVAEIVEVRPDEKIFLIKVNHSVLTVAVKDKYDELLHELGIDLVKNKIVNDIKAPMPGLVLRVMVENGQLVKKGDALVVLEAMKMENILKSPSDGVVRKIHISKGDKVEKNQVMVNLA